MSTNLPLHSQVYGTLRECILSGEWEQGDRVPSERRLVEEFGVSRGTVRQALAALRAEGLVLGGSDQHPGYSGWCHRSRLTPLCRSRSGQRASVECPANG
ncbi:winged helix-turn-helix transcriptional regulator [Leucobacter coleopterorum]|uniref:Winged helix-turn-helix transcriptional regulator n=1 Tax=Leucobacter coleopterorum TaxID=2714933 RepID=A0ABX6JZ11_9MICO|nr:winged helix-turn-helix domain-containing protein [Leucobacter coleopterorum]QIM18202.1 winged helix-turn-helix transcriptional regulator [Leucobacter coleopterorum]